MGPLGKAAADHAAAVFPALLVPTPFEGVQERLSVGVASFPAVLFRGSFSERESEYRHRLASHCLYRRDGLLFFLTRVKCIRKISAHWVTFTTGCPPAPVASTRCRGFFMRGVMSLRPSTTRRQLFVRVTREDGLCVVGDGMTAETCKGVSS